MKITVTLTNKQLSNKEFLIAVRVYADGKYKHYSTGVSCTKGNWNSNSNTVSSRDRNYKEKNQIISEKLQKVTGIYNTEKGVVADATIRDVNTLTFFDIIDLKIQDCNTHSYKKNFLQLKKHLQEHFATITNVTQEVFNTFLESLNNKTEAQQTKLIKHFKLVYNFALENGYIKEYCKFKYNVKQYNKAITKQKYLTYTEFSCIVNAYKKAVESKDIENINVDIQINALCVYILHLAFQGLAPVDLAGIRVKDLKIETLSSIAFNYEQALNSKEYVEQYKQENKKYKAVTVSFKRQKTNVLVNVCTSYNVISPILGILLQGKNADDYLINCLDANKTYTEKQKQSRITNYYTKLAKALNEYMSEYCKIWDVQELQHITYYSARHTIINALASINTPYNIIKRLVGHKDSTLEKYYIADTDKTEFAKLLDKLFNNVVTMYSLMKK